MIKRKGKFLTFCFSMLPGAGHMYLGFMKQGISLMLLLFGTLFFTQLLNLEALLFFLPIVWFYSFFDVINKNSLRDEDFYKLEDHYLFSMDFSSLTKTMQGKFRKVIAYVLILIGISLLFSNFNYAFGWILDGMFGSYLRRLPQIILAVFIIWVGIRLIRGKKIELLVNDETIAAQNCAGVKGQSKMKNQAEDGAADITALNETSILPTSTNTEVTKEETI